MKAEKEREHIMKFRLSDGEKNHIETKYKASGRKYLSEYLRCQAIFGSVFLVDESNFLDIKRKLAGACNNINQIAHIANFTQQISKKDIEVIQHLKREIEEVFEAVMQLQDLVKGRI
jgi:predicted short-subunit dehydrogenase-like oxidoreductase (DUF2520 family)